MVQGLFGTVVRCEGYRVRGFCMLPEYLRLGYFERPNSRGLPF